MNRCMTASPRRAGPRLAGILGLMALCSPALAKPGVRQFPDQAVRATMVVVQPPEVRMDDKPMRLSPGSRIMGTTNTVVLSAGLVGQKLTVNYVPDPLGQVHQVWILTPAEAAQKPARQGAPRGDSAVSRAN